MIDLLTWIFDWLMFLLVNAFFYGWAGIFIIMGLGALAVSVLYLVAFGGPILVLSALLVWDLLVWLLTRLLPRRPDNGA